MFEQRPRRRSLLIITAVVIALAMTLGACSVDTSPAQSAAGPLSFATPTAIVPITTIQPSPVAAPTAQSFAAPTAQFIAPVPTEAQPTAGQSEPTAEPTIEVTADGCVIEARSSPDPARPRYEIDLDVNLAAGTVTGSQRIGFTPDLPIDELMLRLWPNGPRPAAAGNKLTISDLRVAGVPHDVVLDASTVARVALAKPVAAGERIEIDVDFVFALGAPNRGRMAATGEWARFGTFYPLLPWEPGVGWAAEAPTSGFAEAVTSPVADYQVAINGVDDFDVLATGTTEGEGVWQATAVRDFAVSIGEFARVSEVAMAPEPVMVEVGVQAGVADDPQAYLDRIVAALEFFAERWGPYPWPSLSVALTPELSGGIEFPTHIMQGLGSIGRTTPHEVAHQWFYALVGNNQGRDPWLDEGLATYAEFRFEGVDAQTRAVGPELSGLGGQSMDFWEQRFSDYYPAVYVNPAVALSTLADSDALDCVLRRYVAANAWGIAQPDAFFEAADGVIDDVDSRLAPFGLVRISPQD